jgi:ElaB/YqjD/DUF883 family membrane-anchored ribosome-binding protein
MATATKDTIGEFEAEMAAIRNDLAALREDIAAIARTAASAATEQKNRATEALRDKAEELTEKGEEMVASFGHEVEARPFAAVAIAFGLGFVLGKILDRR